MIRLLSGDCRDVLPTLPAESVQCVVTSPPYYGLRDYGTALWDGGDAGCDHKPPPREVLPPATVRNATFRNNATTYLHQDSPGRVCRCGAVRVDRQIGLEATPDEYLATMVGVFRELKRVLRSDGCCFVNLGDSYCSATQCVRYELREHLSLSELQNVALAVFGVRITGDEEAGEGAMPQVLPTSGASATICGRPDMASQGEQEGLFAAPLGGNSRIGGSEQTDEAGRDCGSGGQVRLLRRDDTAIPDAGSHQRRRGSPPEENGALNDQDLPPSQARGLSEAQVSNPLLQLQLRDRLVRLLSARQFAADEIPASVRACFKASATLKPKDLLLMPARLALALQADGWWVRSDVIWHKPNPMPESCTDRPTSAHEHVFLLTRSARYFYDADAVRSPLADKTFTTFGTKHRSQGNDAGGNVKSDNWGSSLDERKPKLNGAGEIAGAALRNVWTIATHAYSAAHFATFPPELAERCIRAGTSERGCCAACGKPWVRVTEVERRPGSSPQRNDAASLRSSGNGDRNDAEDGRSHSVSTTTGWSPGCQCHGHFEERPAAPDWISDETGERKMVRVWVPDGDAPKPVPCTVLDPFAGAGTTLLVADRQQRDCIGVDLNVDYTRMAMDRCIADAPLFTSFPPAEPPEDERMADLFTDMAAD